ncbi:MAG TPA: toprim domain-containing protein, partial [Spirochaetota bacterium]|nr:toprim domain-containing protein [Spirochaetota bacterium]
GEFRGLYHVLHGLISPLDGIGPDELNIGTLVGKCRGGDVREVILALNPSVEGDATSLYMARLINPFGVTVTRIAHGLPVGADLEFADTATIIKSLVGRVKM